jgi:hypothetical protein
MSSNAVRKSTTSDEDGRFSFTGLPSSVYRVAIAHQGDLVESRSPESEHVLPGSSITLVLRKGGVITGRVLTSTGEPLVEGAIKALRIRDEDDRPVIGANSEGPDEVLTDDRGIYRIYGLRPGGYVVCMAAGWFGAAVYFEDIPTYYPSSSRETASVVAVHAGEEITGIDIRHRSAAGRTVSGRVKWPATLRPSPVSLMLVDRAIQGAAAYAFAQLGAPDFEFYGVADGDYDVLAESEPRPRNEEKSTSLPRRVLVQGADISGVEITMRPLATVTGKVVLEGTLAEAQPACPGWRKTVLQEATIQFFHEGPRMLRGPSYKLPETAVDSRNEFMISGIQPGRYHIRCFLPSESLYMLAAATQTRDLGNGVTLASGDRLAGVTVKLAEGAASVKGSIVNGGTRRFRIHLVPAERERADNQVYFYETVAARDGSFLLTHVAPGSYWAIAREIPLNEPLESESPVAWDSPARGRLRAAAEAAKNDLKLTPCQRVESYSVRYSPASK